MIKRPPIILTSFQQRHLMKDILKQWQPKWKAYSIAVYQPQWFDTLPKCSAFNILDKNNIWIRPRNYEKFRKPLVQYGQDLYELYHTRRARIERWLTLIQKYERVYLCCWCPYDRAAQRQIKQHGTFVCHSAAVEWFLRENFGIVCIRDNDRDKMIELPWKREEEI